MSLLPYSTLLLVARESRVARSTVLVHVLCFFVDEFLFYSTSE